MYRELGLSVKRTRRKHLRRTLHPRPVLTAPNQEWALDFASDVTAAGQRFRVFGGDRQFHPAVSGIGGRHQFPQPARYPRARTGDRGIRKAAIDSQ